MDTHTSPFLLDIFIPHTSPSLLDIFMPEDLCARCAENDPLVKFSVTAEREGERVRLSFCSSECRESFVVGHSALQRFPILLGKS